MGKPSAGDAYVTTFSSPNSTEIGLFH